MKSKYPLTLAAVKKSESSLWDIGDALLEECPPDSEHGSISGACQYLQANGCDHDENWLFIIRQTASVFPPNLRQLKFAFELHREAGSPAMLKAIVTGAPEGTLITKRYIRQIVQRLRDQEDRKRQEAYEKAQAKRQAAEAEAEEKLARARQAKTAKERSELAEEHQKAVERTMQARRAEEQVRTAPKRRLTPPEKREMPALVAESKFLANASESTSLAKKAAEAIEGSLDYLTPKGIAALTESGLEAANAWRDAVQVIRKVMVDERGHLSVVEN